MSSEKITLPRSPNLTDNHYQLHNSLQRKYNGQIEQLSTPTIDNSHLTVDI